LRLSILDYQIKYHPKTSHQEKNIDYIDYNFKFDDFSINKNLIDSFKGLLK